jgi:cellobiose phosphorylase
MPHALNLASASGLRAALNGNGSLRRLECDDVVVNLFPGNELEGGPANIWLRRRAGGEYELEPLLGPRSATSLHQENERCASGVGAVGALDYAIALVLSAEAPAWFWRISLENTADEPEVIDLLYTQDLALAPYGAIRTNEYYVSQYVDHTSLMHARHGVVVASRQNQAVNGRNPWSLIGATGQGAAFATDALQVFGLAPRAGGAPTPSAQRLPGTRLQHEHSLVAIRDTPLTLSPHERVVLGFFGLYAPHHPDATSAADLPVVDKALALEGATHEPRAATNARSARRAGSLFTEAPVLGAEDLHEPQFVALFGAQRRHEERDDDDRLLSFFYGADRHVVLRAKELRVLRPHGHMLRTGRALTPDEGALTSTTWMSGVFHSMLTQGHVSINRFLSTSRTYLNLFRSHGLRVFAEIDGAWRLLDEPSAFEMGPALCRWIYRHAGGEIHVRSEAHSAPHCLTLSISVQAGSPMRFLISHHIALNGDDGSLEGPASWRREGDGVAIAPAGGSELAARFPNGSFLIAPAPGTTFERVGGDELLFTDGQSRAQPYICVVTLPGRTVELSIVGRLAPADAADARDQGALLKLHLHAPPSSPLACAVQQLSDITPWFIHNALVHYLSPRGLEQYSGGGWGARDVSQGPVELLLALGETQAVRDLLLRVMRAQNPDGDWPQWFMFFERERGIRAGDSHGDVVFWPVLALAHYLIASGDASVLEEVEPFYAAEPAHAEQAPVLAHVERALALIERRVITGTALAAYGHGDWNDSLQPASPAMREHLCSAWTVTLHHQTLITLARALRVLGRTNEGARYEAQARAVHEDFQRLLLVDDVLAGYALFEQNGVRYLLHPRDEVSGVRYSSLAMIHAILEDMLTPEQARRHLAVIADHLMGPDGVRLFDRPMPYHGGPQRFFQRAESAAYFGREIGLMYMHAHLRYAQALARVGDADGFFRALRQANPIGLRELTPPATLRQVNCYYSSSDAAFADRYEASAQYERVLRGDVALEGGWRVYSSGAGIAISLLVRRFLGVEQDHAALSIDPVMPATLSGLCAALTIYGRAVEVVYEVHSRGCGVASVEVNGAIQKLRFERNPYRKGAARIDKAEFLAALRADGNVMRVTIGGA